jgi:tetratricopeptide (TPR) repeat protein
LLDDEPLRGDSRFSFEHIVEALDSAIQSAPRGSSLSICISGTWGTGKTTVLRSLEARIRVDKKSELLSVWFSPWKLVGDEIRIDLVRKILDAVQAEASFFKGADIALDRAGAVRMLADRVLNVDPTSFSTTAQWTSRARGTFLEVEDLFRRIASAFFEDPKHPRRLVVLIDDLDRCPPGRVVDTLEAVKLFLDLPGLVFVFALDREQVERSLLAHPPGTDAAHAKTYLDKFFQLTYPLPRKDLKSLVDFLVGRLGEVSLEITSTPLATAIVNRYDRNPRNIKLFVNRCAFQRRLMVSGAGQIDTEILLKWLYLEAAIPTGLTAGLARGSFGLLTALEYVALGAGVALPDADKARYTKANSDGIDWVGVVFAALLASMPGADAITSGPLIAADREMGALLAADGPIEGTLRVLREGNSRLIDQEDLGALAYLARTEDALPPAEEAPQSSTAPLGARRAGEHDSWDATGDAYKALGNVRAAYLCYLRAVSLDPTRAMYWTDLAAVVRELGYDRVARALLRVALELDPEFMSAWGELANIVDVRGGDRVVGNAIYRKILQANSGTATSPYNYAMNLLKDERYEEALSAAIEAVAREKPGEDQDRKLRLAEQIARRLGRKDLAFETWNEGLRGELDTARTSGNYPPQVGAADSAILGELIAGLPTLADCESDLTRLLL